MIEGKPSVLLGITGGIAAFKSAVLASMLVKCGIDVHTIMTPNALELVGARTLQALTGNPVYTETFPQLGPGHPHIHLARQSHVMCVAPATANYLGKLANGIADDLLSTTSLAFEGPILIAPAMNQAMWDKPSVQRNMSVIRGDGAIVVGPEAGRFSCGEAGCGRMSEPIKIARTILDLFASRWDTHISKELLYADAETPDIASDDQP